MATGTERIKAYIEGKKLDEHILTATWMHVPAVDRDPEQFPQAIIDYAEQFGSDLVKIQQNAVYLSEAYGSEIQFFENPPIEYKRKKKLVEIKSSPVKTLQDLRDFKELDVRNNPVIQREAKSIRAIAGHYKGTKPVIPTLFSSYSYLRGLTGGQEGKLQEFLEADRNAVHKALQILNEVNKKIVDVFAEAGADGFFFATAFTSPLTVSEADFEEFHRQYDQDLLEHIHQKGWFNILHIHGNADLYIEKLVQYPVEAINWEAVSEGIAFERLTSPQKLRSLTDKVLIGGLDQFHDLYGKPEEVKKRYQERLATFRKGVEDGRFVFGAGCSLPLDIPAENIRLIRKVADEAEKEV